ncbi:MAG: hypothetical protein MZW92_24595 [Comamonadaceae bacterium]|nr:hypothetical protein [Comamonadaceae bacterium]
MNTTDTTMRRDFAAFQVRALAGAYEKREEPGLGAVAETIGKIAESFEQFKEKQKAEAEASRARWLEKQETKLNRPGALTGVTLAPDSTCTSYTVNGKPVAALHGADEIRSHYAQRGDLTQFGMSDFMRGIAGLSTPHEVRGAEHRDRCGRWLRARHGQADG